jgi:hypothetical protein
MRICFGEPTIAEILSDPIVDALMEADGVDRVELKNMIMQLRWNASTYPGSVRRTQTE